MTSIQEQFWPVLAPDEPPLDFEFEFVKEFDERILEHAKELLAWAFTSDKRTVIVGFPLAESGGLIRVRPYRTYVTLNQFGIWQEILTHDGAGRAFILRGRFSASNLVWLNNILKYGDDMLYDNRCIQHVIDGRRDEEEPTTPGHRCDTCSDAKV